MCIHFVALSDLKILKMHFSADWDEQQHFGKNLKMDIWPGYPSFFIRQSTAASMEDGQFFAGKGRELMVGNFGLLPYWAKDEKFGQYTYNARSETVREKPSFREPFRKAQKCIVPMQAFYEPDWRSGRAVATRFQNKDGTPLGVAGLWSFWQGRAGVSLYSFTLLTTNADNHPLLKHFHQPHEEKRMVVVLPPEDYTNWLLASPKEAPNFFKPYELLEASVP